MKVNKPIIFLLCLFLAGCWDQNMMKNAVLVQVLSLDLAPEDKFTLGVSIPIIEDSSGGAQSLVKSETFSATGPTPRDIRRKIDREISGILDTSKNKLILFGKQMASSADIYPLLDVFWRDPRNSLGATLGVVEGDAVDLLNIQPKHETNVSEYIQDALTSAEENSIIPNETIQTLASQMLDPGEDIVLPYLKMNGKKSAVVVGLALMDERKYAGNLSPQDSALLLLLKDKKGKYARFTKKLNNKEPYKLNNYISFNVQHLKRKLKVQVKNGEVYVMLNLNLKLNIEEYPKGDVPKEIEKLNKILSKELTNDAERVITKLQQTNCDALGIGRRLMAFQPHAWKSLDKKEYFKNIQFNTNVKVDIISHGIVL
jgi:Ger(x)C family germination protein